jgi:hypothetical protein
MSIRHSAAAIAVATAMFGSGFRIATAASKGLSHTTVGFCEHRAHKAATAASAGKDDAIQRRALTLTAAAKGSRSNDGVREGNAVVTELAVSASAITYWVSESDGWHVVTTLAFRLGQDQDDKTTVVRFSAVLLPGQILRISVPVAIGERQQVLCIRRLGDRLDVARVFGSSV